MAMTRLSQSAAEEVHAAVARNGSVCGAARELGIARSTVQSRYERAIQEFGLADVRNHPLGHKAIAIPYNASAHPTCSLTLSTSIQDGVAVCFGDAHWTHLEQPRSLAHEALLAALPQIAPDVILSVGDLMDLGEPSRHAPLMWQKRHRVREELDAARQHLSGIVALAPKSRRYWVRGNHDDRYDKWLADNAAAFEGIHGLALTDHFPDWEFCWRLNINDDVVAMHRYHGGIHAGWNNTVKAGVTTITGDTHSLEIKPMVDFRGRR